MKNNDNFIKRLGKKIYKLKIFNPLRKYIDILMIKIEKSIRFELMVVVGICFAVSFIFYGMANNVMRKEHTNSNIAYNYQEIEYSARNYVNSINGQEGLKLDDNNYFINLFAHESGKAYITDLDGNVLQKSSNVVEDKIDIFSVLSSANSSEYDGYRPMERKVIYPLNISGQRCYFIYSNTPSAHIEEDTYIVSNSFLALILSCLVFIVIFIIVTNKKMKYLDEIASGLKIIANGDLSHHIEERGSDEIRNLASNINYMAEEVNRKIEAERKAENTKADLITNVSHDLRTPLTSIMGYIGLIKEGRYENEETMKEYLGIAFNKAEKLKGLIEDLFEYTKLDNGGIKLNKSKVNLTEFLFQLTEELTPLFEESGLSIIKSATEDRIMVDLDADKMLRVFENLLTNSIKYSFKPGNIVIGVYESNGYATVAVRNKGETIPKEKLEKLFERFYRVEESRNTQTGGTGLGLAIAKNIVDLHEGQIWAECYGEDISFYVKLKISE